MTTLAELQIKLDSVRREVRNLTVMGLDPSQPPDQAALIKELERSARAEMRLRTMALAHARANCPPKIEPYESTVIDRSRAGSGREICSGATAECGHSIVRQGTSKRTC